jgi:hypothetical protein
VQNSPTEPVLVELEAVAPEAHEEAHLVPREDEIAPNAPQRVRAAAQEQRTLEAQSEQHAMDGANEGSMPDEDHRAWSFSPLDPRRTNLDLDRTDPSHWSRMLPDAVPAPASTSGGVLEALDANDVARGLGRGGPVRAAVEQAARSTDAPPRGNATFTVVVFSDGKMDVRVADAQADWSRVLPLVREALKVADVKMAPKSRGLRVTVKVEAKVQYPDGYQPPDEARVSASVREGWPALDLEYRGRRCAAALTVAPGGAALGAGCSAGTPLRLVSARIVAEERL